MAIPKLYSILVKQWPSIVENVSETTSIDALYIDLSSILHQCLRNSKTLDELDKLVLDSITHLIKVTHLKDLLYIAFDGTPPIGKLKEQIQRRRARKHIKGQLDPNILSPGTDYINHLCEYLTHELSLIKHSCKTDIVISDASTPGEGEQKIISHIKSSDFSSSKSFAIYGNDADLIVLSLTIPHRNSFIMRQGQYSGSFDVDEKPFNLINIPSLKDKLLLKYQNKDSQILFDIVFVLCIIGNDFTPSLQSFDLNLSSLNELLNLLKQFHLANEGMFIVDSKSTLVNHDALEVFASQLYDYELEKYKLLHPIKKSLISEEILSLQLAQLSVNDKKVKIKDHLHDVATKHFDRQRKRFYKNKIKIGIEETRSMVSDYIDVIQWVITYYLKNEFSSSVTYEHSFSPRLADFKSVDIKKLPDRQTPYDDLTLKPLHHLALVTPERSFHLLPVIYQNDSKLKSLLRENDFSTEFYRKIITYIIDNLDPKLNEQQETIHEEDNEQLIR